MHICEDARRKSLRGGVERNAAIELLRIISMLMVVMLHHGSHGNLLNAYPVGSMSHILVRFFEQLCMPAVNIFVLISGYFLCESRFRTIKAVNLYTQIWIYSIVFYLVLLINGAFKFEIHDFLAALFPISYGSYWFASRYLVLYLSVPILNRVTKELNRKEHLMIVFVSIFIFCVVNDLTLSSYDLSDGEYSQLWMFILYFIAAYIRKHVDVTVVKKNILILIALGSVLIQMGLHILTSIYASNYVHHANWLTTYDSTLVLVESLAIFILFLKIRINNQKTKRIILAISPLTFGVYLFHENSSLRGMLFSHILHTSEIPDNVWMIPTMLLSVLGIFALGLFIEYVRKKIFSLWESTQWYSQKIYGIEAKWHSLFGRFYQRIIK